MTKKKIDKRKYKHDFIVCSFILDKKKEIKLETLELDITLTF